MKLTQTAAHQPGESHSDLTPLADRLERIEQRIERIEHTPIAAPETPRKLELAAFNQKVLEAVVQTVDERLNEHARQIAESAAKLVDQQVPSLVGALLQPVEEQLREEIEHAAGRSSSVYASAVEAAIEAKLAPLRAELSAKNREIAEMRQRLADSDRNVLDLIMAIGQMCRQAAERISGPVAPPPESAPPPSSGGPKPLAEPEPETPMDPPLETPAPAFAQIRKASSLWRIPVVSLFLLTTGSWLLLHYL